jgi:hypothetical protein
LYKTQCQEAYWFLLTPKPRAVISRKFLQNQWFGGQARSREMSADSSGTAEAERLIHEVEATGDDYLRLDHLDLHEIPKSIGRLTSLRRLVCTSGHIRELPKEFEELRELTLLSLQQHRIDAFPKVVFSFPKLEWLELGWNRLQQIPDEIGQLTNLKVIILDSNKIERLPDSIGQLKNLVTLWINHNPLIELPPTIGNLAELKQLDFRHTPLVELPRSIAHLPKLCELYLGDNPNLPRDLLRMSSERGLPAVRKFLLGEDDPDAYRFKGIEDFNLPKDLLAYLDSRSPKKFDFAGAKEFGYPPFGMVARNDLHVEWLPVLPFDGGPGGPWHVPMVNLIVQEGHPKSPARIFVWLPDQLRFATSDCESHNLFVFHETTTWTRIVSDFRAHFLATNSGNGPDPKFAMRYEESACFRR